ncbi:MAG: histidine--tRNA ligase [Firmicutes bacterium]|nr:histidine--tRNA ligase [Dethiobacter sp.]MBS3888324.1 histidine--tRNA ligase [Bacillota bacterium]MBS4055424.1 histidine--tRNA ligase [Thermaerobacter sp.]
MKINVNPVKGMRDFLPAEVRLREYVKSKITETYEQQGFSLIETPAVENIELLTNSEGGDNLQLIFKILKRGEQLQLGRADLSEESIVDCGLRYDLTLPLSRFYACNKDKLPTPFKAMQIGTVYRAERPQKGRYRAFTQCDIDIIGDASPLAECELIHATAKALQSVHLQDFVVKISDRRLLAAVIASFGFAPEAVPSICLALDKSDKIGWDKVLQELCEGGLEAEQVEQFVSAVRGLSLETVLSYGVPASIYDSLKEVIDTVAKLADGKYQVIFSPTLVRGMGYYTGMVFEIATEGLGLAVAGGGRYDAMIGKWLGTMVPAVGFSIGFERIILLLQERGFVPPSSCARIALLFSQEHDSLYSILAAAEALREAGHKVSTLPARHKLGKQLAQLEAEGYSGYYSCVKGELILFP